MAKYRSIVTSIVMLFVSAYISQPIQAWDVGQSVCVTIEYRSFGDFLADNRSERLTQYLSKYQSPLSEYAHHIVKESDRLGIDYRLLPAIAGVESTFGKRMPKNSYNAWGWAIFTGKNSGKYFNNWEHAITTVLEGIRYKYIDYGAVTVPQIGRKYASSTAWPQSTLYFLNDMERAGL